MKKLCGVLICFFLLTFISSARIIEVADAGITDKLKAVIAAKNAAGGADVTAPTVDTVVIGTDGTTVTLTMSENTTVANQDEDEFNLDCDGASGADVAMTYSSGTGTTSLVFTTGATVIQSGETCNLDYSNAQADEFEDAAGNDLASPITDKAVTNNSEQGASCALGGDDFEGYTAGDDIADQTGWSETGASGNNFDADATYAADSSSKSMFVNVVSSGSVRVEYDAFEDQSSGSFNVTLWLRADADNSATEYYPFDIRDASGNAAVSLKVTGNGNGTLDLWYGTGSSYSYITDSGISVDTWYKIEIEVDMTAADQSIAFNGSQIITDQAYYEAISGSLTKFSFSNYATNAVMDFSIDEICVESGDYAY